MQIPQTKTQRIKAGIHCLQALLIFVAGCLTLAVMTKSGGFGGQTSFYFALCFLTFPALIYLIMVPLWSRAWRFNNVWALAAIDVLFAILWFAAAIAVAVWNAQGISKGKTETSSSSSTTSSKRDTTTTKKDGTCASFGYGCESKCKVSQASVGFGIIIFLLFAVTSYFSIRAVVQYRKDGAPPNGGMRNNATSDKLGQDDPWSSNIDEHLNSTSDDRFAYSHGQQNTGEDSEALLHRNSESETRPPVPPTNDMAHPGRRLSHQNSAQFASPPSYDVNFAPSALSPTGLPTSPNGHVAFPEANYSTLR